MRKTFLATFVLCLSLLLIMQTALPRQAEAGPIKSIVLYIPNRVFDILDIIRLRLRVGPGISAGVHAAISHTPQMLGARNQRMSMYQLIVLRA